MPKRRRAGDPKADEPKVSGLGSLLDDEDAAPARKRVRSADDLDLDSAWDRA
jgi:hypothetical protein